MSDQSEQKSPFRSRPFILAMLVVGAIAICAVIVLVNGLFAGNDDDSEPVAVPTSSPISTPAPAKDPDPSACGLKDYEPTGSVDSPPAAEWELVGTVAAPTDPKGAGPGVAEENGYRSCFAHTPVGALYTAANIVAMGSIVGIGQEVTEKSVIPGAGQQAALDQLAQGTPSTSSARYQIAGYNVLAYDGSTATVDIAVNSSGKLVSMVQSLKWSDGDWKVVLSDNGQPPIAAASLDSLGGFTPWSGA